MKQPDNKKIPVPHGEFVSRLLYLPRGIARLEKLGEKKKFPKNHILLEAGEKTRYCYIVKHGRVAAYEYTLSGEERIYNFNEQNSILLEANLLGINRVTAVRAIKGLKEMSPMERINGFYCIRDVERLKRHQERLL